LHYLNETQHHRVGHINKLSRIEEDHYVWLDRFTIRNLELLHSPNENAKTLLDVIDKTVSPMGLRMLKRWMVLPLKDIQPITERHNIVEYFVKNTSIHNNLIAEINNLGDLERLISKVSTGKVNPREILQLKRALYHIEHIQKVLIESKESNLQKMAEQLNFCGIIRQKMEDELLSDAAVAIGKGSVMAAGVSEELDELRNLSSSSKDILKEIQQREAESTGITSLKIGFNNVFGYYLEVTNVHKEKVPESWHRKQTLTGSERYITEELKDL